MEEEAAIACAEAVSDQLRQSGLESDMVFAVLAGLMAAVLQRLPLEERAALMQEFFDAVARLGISVDVHGRIVTRLTLLTQ